MAIGKGIAAAGSGAANSSSESNANNPKAKSLISLNADESKGDSDNTS